MQCFVKNARAIRMTAIVLILIVACHSVFSFLRLIGISVRSQKETATVSIQTEDRISNIKSVSVSVPVSGRAQVTTAAAVGKETEVSNDSPRKVAASVWCAKDDRQRQITHIYSEPFEYFV